MSMVLDKKYENMERAVATLERFLRITTPDELQRAGIIQGFEFCFELFWKTFKTISEHRGLEAGSPRSALKAAFQQHLIEDDSLWLSMLGHRNESVHTYRDEVAQRIYEAIRDHYGAEFRHRLEYMKADVKALD